jgi:hypothetical protein
MEPRTAFGETSANLRAHVAKGTVITQANHYTTSHSAVTGLNGRVNANVESDPEDVLTISTDGLTAVSTLFASMQDESGDKIEVTPTTLLVPIALKMKAIQLLRSPGQFDSANNAINAYQDAYNLVSSVHLKTAYYYYLGDFKSQILWAWIAKPATEMAVASREEAFANKIIWRCKHSWHGGCAHMDYVYIVRGGSAS